jgi:predicted transcriptional regulator of viral defense system
MSTHQNHLLNLFQTHSGLLTSREISRANIPGVTVTRLLQRGLIERVQRGVYRLHDTTAFPAADAAAEELLELQLRFPYARPCLVSALHLHGLTTTRPTRLQLAIPQNHPSIHVDSPSIEVFYFSDHYYTEGLVALEVRTRMLTVYSAEKTLCDLLRFAPRFGRELYLEGLKKYLRSHGTHQLIAMSKRIGVWTELNRDLEVLTHDQDH